MCAQKEHSKLDRAQKQYFETEKSSLKIHLSYHASTFI